jgi:arabinose-5-phosphate isomerase
MWTSFFFNTYHGDLGMIEQNDITICISYSGESDEIMTLIPVIKRLGVAIIAMTGNKNSAIGKISDVHLDVSVEKEACPHNLAPTSSTTVALTMGDALAVSLLNEKGFSPDDFARSHPSGALGRRLLTFVNNIMKTASMAGLSARIDLQFEVMTSPMVKS